MCKTKTLAIITILAVAISGCGNKNGAAAERLLNEAESQYASGHYGTALRMIDSLRRTYPKEIDVRKRALTLYQNAALRQAQDDLASTDSALQRAQSEYATMEASADSSAASLHTTPEELRTLAQKRKERDSLLTRFDVQCAKIKYIHKKQKE